jgi:hypothetical protein
VSQVVGTGVPITNLVDDLDEYEILITSGQRERELICLTSRGDITVSTPSTGLCSIEVDGDGNGRF